MCPKGSIYGPKVKVASELVRPSGPLFKHTLKHIYSRSRVAFSVSLIKKLASGILWIELGQPWLR